MIQHNAESPRIIAAIMTDKPYPFGEEEDWRNVLLILIEAHKKWQVRAVSLNAVLNAVLALPPARRAAMSANEVDALTREGNAKAAQVVDRQSAQVEKRLKETDHRMLLEALRVYASQQFWPGA
jgi:hypothetical protein